MLNGFLITRPEHDKVTFYLSTWMGETRNYAAERGIKIIDLKGADATKANFESYITKGPEINFVVFNGHGNDTTVTGHNNETIVSVGINEHLLAHKIVYSISCSSAKVLGEKSVEAGALAYVGYKDSFTFYHLNKDKPLQDKVAELFLTHAVKFIQYIINSNTVEDAFNKSKKALGDTLFKAIMEKLDSNIISALWQDYQGFIINSHNLEIS